jgi:GGDEF domain-containing protein
MREHRLLYLDPATGFCDRDRFLTEVYGALSGRDALGVVLLLIEPDRRSRGQKPGLAALRGLAEIIRTTFRSSDIIAFFPDGRFAVAIVDAGSLTPESLIARLERGLEQYNAERDGRSRVGFTASGRSLPAEKKDQLQAALDEIQAEIAGRRAEKGPTA